MTIKKILFCALALSGTASAAFATAPAAVINAADEIPYYIECPNFMNMDLTMPVNDDADSAENLQLVADLLNEANKHMGTRYVSGGKTPRGFDCSGFTGYVFKQFGFKLAASSRGQFSDGIEIETDCVKPGDLLFFKGRRSGSIGHVAIAIDNDPDTGEITFIHAAVKGGIRIDRVSSPYYSRRFVGARRVIN